MQRLIRKILIANRGEIALRIIRTCQERDIKTVAVYSDADRTMPHVLHADEAYRLGPPPSRDSYLLGDRLIGIARSTGADAIHPGYGFLSENPDFAESVRKSGLIFIGPRAESIRSMGNKTEARRLVARAGIRIVPGTPEPIQDEESAFSFCLEHGFPVLLKAAAGGGGKGMRLVRKEEELSNLLHAAQAEALSAFGDNQVYIEKYLDKPRHVEFQILADRFGQTVHLGERECSIQRRHQKVIEESPSTGLTDQMRQEMGDMAIKVAKACGYENAGTIEFLVDGDGLHYFLEMNTRLQVEHPVTEMRTGIDLVAEQIAIAEGNPLPFTQESIRFSGHSVECRICAEDPEGGYLPSTGVITHLRAPQGVGVREDSGVQAGNEITIYYDPLISKLIAWAPTRSEAIRRMLRALNEYQILGVTTNIPLCRFVLSHPRFVAGDLDTHFLSDELSADGLREAAESDRRTAALLCAFIEDENRARDAGAQSGPAEEQARSGWKLRRNDGMRS